MYRGALRVCALLCALGAFAPGARAAWNSGQAVTLTQTSTTSVVASQGSDLSRLLAGRSYVPGGSDGSVLLQDLLSKAPGPGPTGEIAVTAARALPWPKIAQAVGKSLPIIGTALAIAELLDSLRCGPDGAGGASCDAGINPAPVTTLTVNSGIYDCSDSNLNQSIPSGALIAGSGSGILSAYKAAAATVCNKSYGTNPVVTIQVTYGSGSCSVGGSTFSCSIPSTKIYSSRFSNGTRTGPTSSNFTTYISGAVTTPNGCGLTPAGALIAAGPDGKCASGTYTPATGDQIEAKVNSYGDKSKAVDVVKALDAAGKVVESTDPTLSGPATVQGSRQTVTNPDGSTLVKDFDWPITYTPGGYSWQPREQDTTYPPGVTPPAPGATSGGTTTVGSGPPQEINTCGLPGKPPCKIDETGTPTAPAVDPTADVASGSHTWSECLKAPTTCLPSLPSLSWSFSLPTGCTPLSLGYGPVGTVTIDMCAYQSQIHDLMSMLWAAAGLFGALSLMFRDSAGAG